MEYLEERYPEPALLPADPEDRSLARLRIFRHDDFTDPYYDVRRGDESAQQRFEAQLERLDGALEESPWLGGRDYGLADIAYVPWVLRAEHLLGVELDPYPALSEWLHRLLQRPTVAAEAGIVATL
jgi:glutathione S-transferase